MIRNMTEDEMDEMNDLGGRALMARPMLMVPPQYVREAIRQYSSYSSEMRRQGKMKPFVMEFEVNGQIDSCRFYDPAQAIIDSLLAFEEGANGEIDRLRKLRREANRKCKELREKCKLLEQRLKNKASLIPA